MTTPPSGNARFTAYTGASGPGLCYPTGTALNYYDAPDYAGAERSFSADDIGAPAINELIKAIPLGGNTYLIWYNVIDTDQFDIIARIDFSLAPASRRTGYQEFQYIETQMGVFDIALGPDGTVYVLDGEGLRILALPADLSSSAPVSIPENDLIEPYGITVDSNGLIHILDYTSIVIGPFPEPVNPGVKTYASDGTPISTWANIKWHGGGKFINPSNILTTGNGLVYVVDSYPGGCIQVFRQATQSVSSANSSAAQASDETLPSPGPQDEWYITAFVRDSSNQPITGLMHEAFSVERTSGEVTPSVSFVYPDNEDGNYRIALTFDDEGSVSFRLNVMGTEIQAFNNLTVLPQADTVSPRRSYGDPWGGYPELSVYLPSGAVIDRIERLLPAPAISLDPFEEYNTTGPEGSLYSVQFASLTQQLGYYAHDPADNLYKQTLRVYLTDGDRDYFDVWLLTFWAQW